MTTNNSLAFNIEPYDLYAYFIESVIGLELASRRLRHTFYVCFGYTPKLPAAIDGRELVASQLDRHGRVTMELRTWDNGLIETKIKRSPPSRRSIEVYGYFSTQAEAAQCLSVLVEHLPPERSALSDGAVSMNFWSVEAPRGKSEPKRESQTMCVPRWQEIAANYPENLRPELSTTMRLQEPAISMSRTMLWRGLPGTGKTWAIRALMREWRDWCSFHYVVDPAIFFSNSDYMLSLLSRVGETEEAEEREGKWSLIVLEDAGEFIAKDSRHQYGQALAKLLNLSDGLLGQGQKLLFLITTNEELRNIHPAIARHGRCLANLEFSEFSESEAREWMASRGSIASLSPEKLRLSDLYAAAASQPSIVNALPSQRAGFVR
jgi:hypothetical protein